MSRSPPQIVIAAFLIFIHQLNCHVHADTWSSFFGLKQFPDQPCIKATSVDLNYGSTTRNFIKSAYCQMLGALPNASTLNTWAAALDNTTLVPQKRRVDFVNAFCPNSKGCNVTYGSDPWTRGETMLPIQSCSRRNKRDVGAGGWAGYFINPCILSRCDMYAWEQQLPL